MRQLITTIFVALLNVPVQAQQSVGTKSFWDDPISDPMFPFFIVIGFIFIVAILVILVALTVVNLLNVLVQKENKESSRAGANDTLAESHWKRWAVFGTATLVIFFWIKFNMTDSSTLEGTGNQNERDVTNEQKSLLVSNPVAVIDENTLEYNPDETIIQSGRKVYVVNCLACHSSNGEGSVGPNLTDDYWLHKGGIKDIYAVIKNGVPEKGMISWEKVLSPEQIRDVSFYIKSIRGTNPKNPKDPQGERWTE